MNQLDSEQPRPLVFVLGVHEATEGYPNVLYRLKWLRDSPCFRVLEVSVPLKKTVSGARTIPRFLYTAARALIAHMRLLLQYLRAPRADIVYVPYPGVFVLNMLALLPKRLQPRKIVADVFISIYDTAINDRKLIDRRHPFARCLYLLERRACHRAALLVVDTKENATFLQRLFGLPKEKISAVPLSTNEIDYPYSDYLLAPGRVRILFIGTLVPLHGVGVIIEAAGRLKSQTNIEFRIIGNGQDASTVERLIAQFQPNVSWCRDWQSAKALAHEIQQADICLGIFGKTAKAQRVCPLKIYAYASVGRAVITGDTKWLRNATSKLYSPPFATVPVGDPAALAAKILELAEHPAMRHMLATRSREFYQSALSNDVAQEQFAGALAALTP